MTKVSHFQKLRIDYDFTELTEMVMKEVREIMEFISYYEVNASIMKRYTLAVHREELEMLSACFNPEKSDIDFEHLITGTKDPENDIEQLTVNLSAILKSITEVKEDFSLSYLQKLQGALHQKLLHDSSGIGLRMENNSLFAAAEETKEGHPLDNDSKVRLDELLKMANKKDIPPLVRAAVFYYEFDILKPFVSYNELLAYVVCKKMLAVDRLDFFNMLNLDKYIFRDKKLSLIQHQLNEVEDYNEKLNADLTTYIHAFFEGYMNNISVVRESITNCVREQLDYQSLTPRQKNSLNFWLEKAFFIHKDKLDQLTPRQHEMMLLIAKYGSLSNKDLVPVFMVDRKTIQRDFNMLLDLKLLDQRGGGRALKYYINLRVEI